MQKTQIFSVSILIIMSVASATAGPCSEEINRLTQQMAARDAGSGPTRGAQGQNGQSQAGVAGQHPPTATMNKETEGRAASPQDVQRQTMGEPPAAQQSPTAGPDAAERRAAAMAAFNRALMFDQQGNESGCMSALEEIKRLSSE